MENDLTNLLIPVPYIFDIQQVLGTTMYRK